MTSEDRRRGGGNLGGLGPVTEGAVAWIVGLGILLLFTRWIGTRVGDE
jgi:ubiquinol-cytochrome c reductase cytochrome c subunit